MTLSGEDMYEVQTFHDTFMRFKELLGDYCTQLDIKLQYGVVYAPKRKTVRYACATCTIKSKCKAKLDFDKIQCALAQPINEHIEDMEYATMGHGDGLTCDVHADETPLANEFSFALSYPIPAT